MNVPAIVNGEQAQMSLKTPLDALTSFYLAFNTRDLDLMEAVWIAGEQPSMDNPIGGIRRGWGEIKAGYQKLFSGTARVRVEFHEYTLQEFDSVTIAIGRERGWCETPSEKLALAIRTSRILVRTGEGWKQLHHHGSVEYPDMLEQYQTLILGNALRA